jgi:hypothetical protein
VIVPVFTTQVVWEVADASVTGTVLIVTLVPDDIQRAPSFALTRYVPGDTDVNIPLAK